MYSEANGWDIKMTQYNITWGMEDGIWNVSLKNRWVYLTEQINFILFLKKIFKGGLGVYLFGRRV